MQERVKVGASCNIPGFSPGILQEAPSQVRDAPKGAFINREVTNLHANGGIRRWRDEWLIRQALGSWALGSFRFAERSIAEHLPVDVRGRFGRVLGKGGYHLVVLDRGGKVAVRVPIKAQITRSKISAGVAATRVCIEEGVPAPASTGPHEFQVSSMFSPGRSASKIFSTSQFIADAVPLDDIWSPASIPLKQTILRSLTEALSPLLQRPFNRMGSPRIDADQTVTIGPFCSRHFDRAEAFGPVNRGPFSTWVEYAESLVSAFILIYGQNRSVVENLAILREAIPAIAHSKGYAHTDQFYLTHPDLHANNILVEPNSGTVRALIDWDGAVTEPLDCLMTYPPRQFWTSGPEEDAANEQLLPFFCDTLRSIGSSRWADALELQDTDAYNPGCDFALTIEVPLDDDDPDYFEGSLYYTLQRMQSAGIIPSNAAIAPLPPRDQKIGRFSRMRKKVMACWNSDNFG
ncbi:hypothetical protein HDU88_002273 [Geranomyces variabilis]|nr:hypothetical protein HDU88_002273 [Geranomyces variabilis]